MTIKSKLIANILVTAVIIVGISLASFSSMRFLQERLSYIAEKSTPFQMGTVEFQRELQSCITNLLKVNAARNMQEFTQFRAEAEKSLVNATKSQKQLETLSTGSRMEITEGFTRISGELFDATEARIKSGSAANEAQEKVFRLTRESSTRLKELETNVRTLQITHAVSFAKALESTGRFSVRLRSLEELRNQVKELLSVVSNVHNATTSMSFLIAKGKIKTLLIRIATNKNHGVASSDLDTLTEDMNEFMHLHAATISRKDSESEKWAAESLNELAEGMNRINLLLNQEIELASSKLAIETSRQGFIFAQSGNANDILLLDSELVASGHIVSGLINRLFTAGTTADLDSITTEIRTIFGKIDEHSQRIENALKKLYAIDELKKLHASVASLSAIRSELYSKGGIITKLRTKLDVSEQATGATDKLHVLVARQSAKGKESLSAAQQEQAKSITAINSMIRQSTSRIVTIGAAAIVAGFIFGGWIYRSVMAPLRVVLVAVRRQRERGVETARLAEAVAGGDLSRNVIISEALTLDQAHMNNDEMGMVLNAVVGMSTAQVTLDHAFAGMAASLRSSRDEESRRDRLKSGLYELGTILRDDQNTAKMADRALAFIAEFLGAGVGIIYQCNDKDELQTLSTYALPRNCLPVAGFRRREGLVGQVALEKKLLCLNSIPPDYLPIASALGKGDPLNVVILPIMHNEILSGVIELGSFRVFCNNDFEFLTPALEGIAIALNVSCSRQQVNDLLEQSQRQSEELRVQQEELQQTNEELVKRAHMLAEQRRILAETV